MGTTTIRESVGLGPGGKPEYEHAARLIPRDPIERAVLADRNGPLSRRLVEWIVNNDTYQDEYGNPIALVAAIEEAEAKRNFTAKEILALKWWLAIYRPNILFPMAGDDDEEKDHWPVETTPVVVQGSLYAYMRWFHYTEDPESNRVKRPPFFEIQEAVRPEVRIHIDRLARIISAHMQAFPLIHVHKHRQAFISGIDGARNDHRAWQCPGGLFFLTKTNKDEADELLKKRDWKSIFFSPLTESKRGGQKNDEYCTLVEPWEGGRIVECKYTQCVISLKDKVGELFGRETLMRATPSKNYSSFLGNPANGIRMDEFPQMDDQQEMIKQAGPNTSHGNCLFSLVGTPNGYNFHYRKLFDRTEDDPEGTFSDAYLNRKHYFPGYSVWINGSGFFCFDLGVRHDPRRSPDFADGINTWARLDPTLFERFVKYFQETRCKNAMLPRVARRMDDKGRPCLEARKNWFVKMLLFYGPTDAEGFESQIMGYWHSTGGKKMFPQFNREKHTIRIGGANPSRYQEPLPMHKVVVTLDIGPSTKPAAGFYQTIGEKNFKWYELGKSDLSYSQWVDQCVMFANDKFPQCPQEWLYDTSGGNQVNYETQISFAQSFTDRGVPMTPYNFQQMHNRINLVRQALIDTALDGEGMFQIHPENCRVTISGYQGDYKKRRVPNTDIWLDIPDKHCSSSDHMDCDQLFFIHMKMVRSGEEWDDSEESLVLLEMDDDEKRIRWEVQERAKRRRTAGMTAGQSMYDYQEALSL